jgi:hypothetical protein
VVGRAAWLTPSRLPVRPPPVGGGTRREGAAQRAHTLAHAADAEPGPLGRIGRGTPGSVDDLDLERRIRFVHPDVHDDRRTHGVPRRVRQRLLDDPIRHEARRGIDRRRVGEHERRSDVEPAGAEPLDEARQVDQAGSCAVTRAEHSDHAADLLQRLASDVLGPVERLSGPSGVGREQPTRTGDVQHHDGQRVRHDVVHLARDALALGAGRVLHLQRPHHGELGRQHLLTTQEEP